MINDLILGNDLHTMTDTIMILCRNSVWLI